MAQTQTSLYYSCGLTAISKEKETRSKSKREFEGLFLVKQIFLKPLKDKDMRMRYDSGFRGQLQIIRKREDTVSVVLL